MDPLDQYNQHDHSTALTWLTKTIDWHDPYSQCNCMDPLDPHEQHHCRQRQVWGVGEGYCCWPSHTNASESVSGIATSTGTITVSADACYCLSGQRQGLQHRQKEKLGPLVQVYPAHVLRVIGIDPYRVSLRKKERQALWWQCLSHGLSLYKIADRWTCSGQSTSLTRESGDSPPGLGIIKDKHHPLQRGERQSTTCSSCQYRLPLYSSCEISRVGDSNLDSKVISDWSLQASWSDMYPM